MIRMVRYSWPEHDEQCSYCGIPFDNGDKVWINDAGQAYCSRLCELEMRELKGVYYEK